MSARSGTETRRKSIQVGVRLTPAQYAALQVQATVRGVSIAEVLRRSIFPVKPDLRPLAHSLADCWCGPHAREDFL